MQLLRLYAFADEMRIVRLMNGVLQGVLLDDQAPTKVVIVYRDDLK